MQTWWSLELSSEDSENLSAELFDFGAKGVEQKSDHIVSCYFEGDETAKNIFTQEAQKLGFSVLSANLIADRNWVQERKELWEPVNVGKLTIMPCMTLEDQNSTSNDDNQVAIIPGNGFGTGHHGSTFNAILLLQDGRLSDIKTALDAGSGSGILAFAAQRLFGCCVEAYETDPLAVTNAVDNRMLNHMEETVQIHTKSITDCDGQFDLVMANLYAELLQTLASHLSDRVKPQKFLIVSGIMESKRSMVEDSYGSHGFTMLETRMRDGWFSALMQKSR